MRLTYIDFTKVVHIPWDFIFRNFILLSSDPIFHPAQKDTSVEMQFTRNKSTPKFKKKKKGAQVH